MYGSQAIRGLGSAALVLTLCTPLAAQEWVGVGRVSGQVRDEDGNGIEGAMITLRYNDQPDAGPPPFATNKKGKWSFLGLISGQWTVLIEKEGMIPSEGSITVSQITPLPQIVTTMHPIPENKAQVALDLLDEGDALFESKEYDRARAVYSQALERLEPDVQDLVYDRVARTYAAEGNTAMALANVDKAIAVNPGELSLLQMKARFLDQDGRTEESIDVLEHLLELDPNDGMTTQILIELLVRSGRKDEAEAYIARLPEGEKLNSNLLLNLGIDAYNASDYEKALDNFGRAVAENPGLADVYWYRGLVYLAQQNNEPAIADFEKLLELEPEHPKAEDAQEFLAYLKTN